MPGNHLKEHCVDRRFVWIFRRKDTFSRDRNRTPDLPTQILVTPPTGTTALPSAGSCPATKSSENESVRCRPEGLLPCLVFSVLRFLDRSTDRSTMQATELEEYR